MQTTQTYLKKENYLIVGKCIDGKVTSFGIADMREQLVTAKSFKTAYEAMTWADLNYKGLV